MHSGAGTVGWVAPEQIRKAATSRRPADRPLRARLHRLPHPHRAREIFEGTAQDVLRAHKRNAGAADRAPRGVPDGRRAVRTAPAREASRGTGSSSRPTRGARGRAPPFGRASRSRRSSRADARRRAGVAVGRAVAAGRRSRRGSSRCGRRRWWRATTSARQLHGDGRRGAARGRGRCHRMVALIGEAGVGKSRLAEWLCEEVHERGTMMPLRARYGRIPTPLDGAHRRRERALRPRGGRPLRSSSRRS